MQALYNAYDLSDLEPCIHFGNAPNPQTHPAPMCWSSSILYTMTYPEYMFILYAAKRRYHVS